jgi:hypothetical protein
MSLRTIVKVIAYIDEAGAKGFSRNLTAARDHEIGVICSILFPADRVDEMREAYRPGFDAFCAASPAGEKHHFTDAFRPGNETWAGVARDVRAEFEEIIRHQTPPIVYEARRLILQRDAHERLDVLKASAKAARKNKTIRVSGRASTERVESQLIIGLTLKLDAMATDMNWQTIDLWFDEIDDELADHYRGRIAHLHELSDNVRSVKGWDMANKQQVHGSIRFEIEADFPIDVTRVGEVLVVGKTDPLVLVADLVANSLHRHLRGLPFDAALNAPASIAGWSLEDLVWGVRDGAIEDRI